MTEALLHGSDSYVLNGAPVNATEPTCDRDGFVAWLNLKLAGLGLDALYSSYLVSMLEQGADASSFIRNLAVGNVSPQVLHILCSSEHIPHALMSLQRAISSAIQHNSSVGESEPCTTSAQALDALISELWQRWYGEDAAAGTVFAPGEAHTVSTYTHNRVLHTANTCVHTNVQSGSNSSASGCACSTKRAACKLGKCRQQPTLDGACYLLY
jgi:hypothetical protein